MRTLFIHQPDDWHLHLRDGDRLARTVADASRYFGRAIVMPNLTPPVTTPDAAAAYAERIRAQRPHGSDFQPLMTLYLTDETSPALVRRAARAGITAFKLYPAGATTNSAAGIRSVELCYPAFAAMQEADLPLLIHGEVTDPEVDIFDREAVFIERHLAPLVKAFPALRVVLEHITTSDAVEFILDAPDRVAATITAHHLLYNRTDMLAGGMNPLYYCLPVLKRDRHQQALRTAVRSGERSFFLGTDSAPHPASAKERCLGCAAGIYTAHAALELYAEVFDELNALDCLEDFASHRGADFYRLPRNTRLVRLSETPWQVPTELPLGDARMVPVRAGGTLRWQAELLGREDGRRE